MKKRSVLALMLLVVLLAATACTGTSSNKFEGAYTAVNPPVESGEMVIEELNFSGDKVTMSSGDVSQTVRYKLEGDSLSLLTDYGTFTFACEQKADGTLVIDGVDYKKQ